jgi:hypothetical protein
MLEGKKRFSPLAASEVTRTLSFGVVPEEEASGDKAVERRSWAGALSNLNSVALRS